MTSLQRRALAWLIASAISFGAYFVYTWVFVGAGLGGNAARLTPIAALLIAGYTALPAVLTVFAALKTGWPAWVLGTGVWSVLVIGLMTPFLLRASPLEIAAFFLPMLATQAVSGAVFGGVIAGAPSKVTP